jgi:hypothetical protein
MNTPPTIKGKELRPLNKFIWSRLCEFLSPEKSRGKSSSFILIYGYAAIAMAEKKDIYNAMSDDDAFFFAMTCWSLDLTEAEENEIGEYVQGVVNRWEAAQIETESSGKNQTEATLPTTEIS